MPRPATVLKETHVLGLPDKSLYTTVINMLKELENIVDKEIRRKIYEQNESIHNDTKAIKKN